MAETYETKVCGSPAIYLIAWAGKQVPYCLKHANGIQTVASAMGMPAEAVANPDNSLMCTSKERLEDE